MTHNIPIADAKGPQLRRFAAEFLGLEFGQMEKVVTMRAKIKVVWTKDHIIVSDDIDQTAAPVAAEAVAPAIAVAPGEPGGVPTAAPFIAEGNPAMVTIIIAATEEPGGADDVTVGVNGKAMLIPRGKPAPIPWAYYEVLCNAVYTRYDPLPDGGMSPPREVPAYPFQRVA